ncbi:GTPase ObgE [candidate division KSB1 bacterium]
MKFIDEITLSVKAGNGGNGVVRWLQQRGNPRGGPAGGNGGKGADVYARAVRDINVLSKYRGNNVFVGENGGEGKKSSQHGKNGENLYINLPIGSIVTNATTSESFELLEDGQQELMIAGGYGGLGNEHFKSSTNVVPKQWTPGKPGGEADFNIELALIADAGFIGLPNAGKSSLLNTITHAEAKVGSYQFTTLDPNLGDFYGYILADIPGIIEGASEGKGLGHKFLRHVTRTKILIHCISLDSADPVADYHTIRNELVSYNKELGEKKEIIVLTKSDLVSEEKQKEVYKELSKETSNDIFTISILDDKLIKEFSDTLARQFKSS